MVQGKPVAPKRIMVVDDEPDVVDAIARTLRAIEDIEVETCTDPHRACERLLHERFAVVISDYDMPGLNGLELLDRVREARPETVRILLTGRATMDTAVAAINSSQVFRFIRKPFDAGEVRTEVFLALTLWKEHLRRAETEQRARQRAEWLARLESLEPGVTRSLRPIADPGRARQLARALGLSEH